jgi:hypothetical protein
MLDFSLRPWGTAPVSLFPLKYLQIEKIMSPLTMVIFVRTSYGKHQSMLTYSIVRSSSCAKASGIVPVNSFPGRKSEIDDRSTLGKKRGWSSTDLKQGHPFLQPWRSQNPN